MRLTVLVVLVLIVPVAMALSPPSAPLFPSATAGAGVGEIDLSWTAPLSSGSSPIAGYKIYRSLTATGLTFLVDIPAVLAFTDNTVPDGAPRFYRIAAMNGDGPGPLSDVVNASAKAPPTVPLAFTAGAGPGRNNITLAWNLPLHNGTADITSYNVYRASSWAGPFSLHASPSTRNFTDLGLGDNATFAYRVSAVNVYGEGPATAVLNATSAHTPGAPFSVSAGMFPGSGILIEWDKPGDTGGLKLDAYHIERAVGAGPWKPFVMIHPFFGSYRDKTCPPPNECSYRMRATNEVGWGAYSNTAKALADPLFGILA